MPATLIYDNAKPDTLHVPAEMGTPLPHQLQGSPLDRLTELAGRVCYSSLGSPGSRSSADYHAHIREVRHLSVYRHAAITVEVSDDYSPLVFLNRPCVWVTRNDDSDAWRVTLNLQHVLEWDAWTHFEPNDAEIVGDAIRQVAGGLAPLAAPAPPVGMPTGAILDGVAWRVDPAEPDERWLSFYVHGVSRGLTHELVRHGAYCAPSQRSTRYCDESESAWVWHPAIVRRFFTGDASGDVDVSNLLMPERLERLQGSCRSAYADIVESLTRGGVDRKAARGAARGVLGNALATELVFSASLAQWRRIVAQRNSPHADEEIRNLAAEIAAALPA